MQKIFSINFPNVHNDSWYSRTCPFLWTILFVAHYGNCSNINVAWIEAKLQWIYLWPSKVNQSLNILPTPKWKLGWQYGAPWLELTWPQYFFVLPVHSHAWYLNKRFKCILYINSSHPNSGRRETIKLSFYFHTSLWCLRMFYEDLSVALI